MRTIIAAVIGAAVMVATPAAANAPEPAAKPLPPCVQEDSPGPCVWDAKHMGNGIGRSFLALPVTPRHNTGRVVYLSHREAHQLLSWKG